MVSERVPLDAGLEPVLFRALGRGPLDRLTALAAATPDITLRLDVLRGMEAALRGRNGVTAPSGWNELESTLAAAPDAETQRLARNLGTVFGSARALNSLRAIASDSNAASADRAAALETLLRTRDAALVPLLQKLTTEAGIRATALRGLAGFDDARPLPCSWPDSHNSLPPNSEMP